MKKNFFPFLLILFACSSPQNDKAPWDRIIPLKELAKTQYINGVLQPVTPQTEGGNGAFLLNNYSFRAALWGSPDRITISILKNDVYDRRYGKHPVVTLEQVREGVYSPANRGFDDMPPDQRRPVRGYLLPEGGRYDPF